MDNWKLIKVKPQEWHEDKSGVYSLISWNAGDVRVDIMTKSHEPMVSFIGPEHDVRIALMVWMANTPLGRGVSLEHAAYIGREIYRCSIEMGEFIQD